MTTATQTPCDMAIEILRATNDGDDLAPVDLKLLETAVNGWLTEAGEVAFYDLHSRVSGGEYVKPWLCGIEHLTIGHTGYVYWKGIQVEHYSFREYEPLKAAAVELARRCRLLEARGEAVIGLSAVWNWEHESMKGGA